MIFLPVGVMHGLVREGVVFHCEQPEGCPRRSSSHLDKRYHTQKSAAMLQESQACDRTGGSSKGISERRILVFLTRGLQGSEVFSDIKLVIVGVSSVIVCNHDDTVFPHEEIWLAPFPAIGGLGVRVLGVD